ncbi:hypothetical protein BGX38DRAFT_1183477 [Terfezia claveryi]|nr:hypothetical protein BGX38DRAFT_1183477 [Terfezia claveryi]
MGLREKQRLLFSLVDRPIVRNGGVARPPCLCSCWLGWWSGAVSLSQALCPCPLVVDAVMVRW